MEKSGILILLCLHATVVIADESSPFLDMSYLYNGDTFSYPGLPAFDLTIMERGYSDAFGVYIEMNKFCMFEHCGTHMDAPAHFYEGALRVHEVPLTSLIGSAVKVDIKAKVEEDVDALLEVSDLEAWEEANGRIPDDVILMIYYGWGSRYGNKTLFFGTDTNNTELLHFPGMGHDAARWLVNNRKVKAIGVDTPSFDRGKGKTFGSHVIVFEHNIPVFEMVANLDKLPTKGATVFAIPMKIEDGSGAPVRIFATGWRPDVANPFTMTTCASQPLASHSSNMVFVLALVLLYAFF